MNIFEEKKHLNYSNKNFKDNSQDHIQLKTFTEVQTIAPRMPSEIAADWMNTLKNNVTNTNYTAKQKKIVQNLLSIYKERWMAHEFTIDSIKNMLKQDRLVLRKVGLNDLADKAFSVNTQESLYTQLPRSSDPELNATRLNDNVYGRKFENEFIKYTIDHSSKNILDAMTKAAEGLKSLVRSDENFITHLQYLVRNDYRPWFESHPEIKDFINTFSPGQAYKNMAKILSMPVDSGARSMLVAYLGPKIYKCLLLTHRASENWVQQTQDVYDIIDAVKKVGIDKTNAIPPNVLSTKSIQNALSEQAINTFQPGIGFAHHNSDPSSCNGKTTQIDPSLYSEMPVSKVVNKTIVIPHRPVQTTLLKTDNLRGVPKLFLEHGVPSGAGVSGTTNIWLSLLSHFKNDLKIDLNAKNAFMGVLQFLNYDGGHSINEVLWTAHLRENLDKIKKGHPDLKSLFLETAMKNLQSEESLANLKIGLDGLTSKVSSDPIKFIADYESLISLYDENSPVRTLLLEAKEHAFKKVFEHFEKYSQYAPRDDAFLQQESTQIAVDTHDQEGAKQLEQKQPTSSEHNPAATAIEDSALGLGKQKTMYKNTAIGGGMSLFGAGLAYSAFKKGDTLNGCLSAAGSGVGVISLGAETLSHSATVVETLPTVAKLSTHFGKAIPFVGSAFAVTSAAQTGV